MKVVYSRRYGVAADGGTFQTRKFAATVELLLKRRLIAPRDVVEPPEPSRADLELAHAADWVGRALECRLTREEEERLELPWSKALAVAHALAVSGTLLAAREALAAGAGLHAGGGAHHAFPDHGEGYCAFNDLACAVLRLRAEGRVRRAAIVDLDAHQGNGTNAIFAGDPDTRTFSIHQEDLYPAPRFVPGTLDAAVPAGMGDERYLTVLDQFLTPFLARRKPDLVVYQAGVDGHEADRLGGLGLSAEGLARRDRFVFSLARRLEVPIAVTLGGGYGPTPEATAALHARTLQEALAAFGERPGPGRNTAKIGP